MAFRSAAFTAPSILANTLAALLRAGRAWRGRRSVGHLARLDDHMLADIGVTRADVLGVLAEPLTVDPSLRLAARARETRHNRREAALEALEAVAPRRPSRNRAA